MKGRTIVKGLFISFALAIILILFFGVKLYQQHQFAKNRLLELQETVTLDKPGERKMIKLTDPNKAVIYRIEDENVAKIDDNGNIVAVGKGETKIQVTNEDKSKKQTVTIKVGETKNTNTNKKPSTGVIKSNNSNNINKNNTNSTGNTNNSSNVNKNTTNNTGSTNSSGNTQTPNSSGTTNKTPSSSGASNSGSINKTPSSSSSTNTNSSSTTNKTPSSSSTTPSTPSVVRVSGVSLNKQNQTIDLNSNSKSFSLVATVSPYNANNKGVNWSSSNNSVATVNGGVVTAKNPGTAVITVSTYDGNKTASMTVTVTKKVVIVVGASQVTRMTNVTSYKNYNTSSSSLVYIAKSGSGIEYQYNEGLTGIKNIMNKYSSAKGQVQFYVFFPLSGNTIKGFKCDQISSDNSSIKEYAKGYSNAIGILKNSGYNVKGYVVSMHPVKVSQTNSSYVVTNQNNNACDSGYRSNYKYYKFNKAIKSRIETSYSANLKYLSLFIKIMDVGDGSKHNFSYNVTYNTTDGVHWDASTTKYYVDLMLSTAGV